MMLGNNFWMDTEKDPKHVIQSEALLFSKHRIEGSIVWKDIVVVVVVFLQSYIRLSEDGLQLFVYSLLPLFSRINDIADLLQNHQHLAILPQAPPKASDEDDASQVSYGTTWVLRFQVYNMPTTKGTTRHKLLQPSNHKYRGDMCRNRSRYR